MDPSTPYLDRLARHLRSALSALAAWLARTTWPALSRLARKAGRNAGRFFRWLDRFLSANKRDLALYAGLGLAGWGLGLRFGLWLGLLAPGAVVVLVAVFGVAPVKDDKSAK